MLTQRLTARCENANMIGVASISNYSLAFSKRSNDRSGKATLAPSDGGIVHGAMFKIPLSEREKLDVAEGPGYDRSEVEIVCSRTSNVIIASTYIALPDHMDATLIPYDWYHTLVIAGAEQHALPAAHIETLRRADFVPDAKLNRKGRLDALNALDAADYIHSLPYPS